MADRPYQARTINAIRAAIGAGKRRILVVMPTGAGKGYQAARVMEQCAAKGNPNIFFAAQRELITQVGKQLQRLDIPYRTIMSGVSDEYGCFEDAAAAGLCSIVAKDTLWARAVRSNKMELPDGVVLQIDEAHQSLSKTYQALAERYKDSILIGWTATPCRTDGRSLGDFYDHLIQGATYAELQSLGNLVPIKVIAPDRPDLKGLKVSKGDYTQGTLEQRMNRDEMVGNIIKEWEKNAQGRQTVAFLSGIQHSIHVRNEFRKLLGRNGDGTERVEHIDGKMPQSERDDIMGRIADGRVVIACNYGVLHTGVDFPAWKYLICARPTKSFSLWRQMGGRIQRPHSGYAEAMIQDHSDNCHNFGYPDEDVEWSLDTKAKAQDLPRTERNKPPTQKKDPYKCQACGTEYRGPHCPSCGHKTQLTGEDVKMKKGDLVELQRKANRQATIIDKQASWDKALGLAIAKGQSVGAAAHMYRNEYGVFPCNKIQNVPRSSQWKMKAKDFYMEVVKPIKEQAKRESQAEAERMMFSE